MSSKVLAMGFVIFSVANLYPAEPADSMRMELKEVVVRGAGAERNLNAPQMGEVLLGNKQIMNMPVMFGEPDLVKTLQSLPGVSQGVEGFTGLYVRGGDNDQNLFLYEGLPLYHVSHLGGIFSSFNVATIDHVGFYKASFPAEYGGRISSITDVKMKQSDFERYTGKLTIGLLCANAYISGPILKDKTAFAVGLRRSWIDVVSAPTIAVMNTVQKKNGKKHIAHYAFTDFNARIDQRIGGRAHASVVGYYGHDNLKIGERNFESVQGGNIVNGNVVADGASIKFYDEDVNRLSWGNYGVIGSFGYRTDRGMLDISAYYSKYSSTYSQESEYQNDMSDASTYGYNRSRTDNEIRDLGVAASYEAEFGSVYSIKAGVGFVYHDYLPEGLGNESLDDGAQMVDNNNSPHVKANELYAYVGNTLNITDWVALNAGLRVVGFRMQSRSRSSVEPRASLRIRLSRDYSVKVGYAQMGQFVQQVSNNYINLPTDLWQPVATRFRPLRSDQYSLGIYGNLPYSMYFSVEGWYKYMHNLLEYREGVSSLNPGLAWEDKLTSGKGWSYGLDLSITKDAGKFTGTVGYGLMWNWRKFAELNLGRRFPAKFDNRHKININVGYKPNKRFEFNAGWTFTTGNRLTLSLYNYDMPGSSFPDAPSALPPGETGEITGLGYLPGRNNVRMPAYHRLDISMNIYKSLKKGRMGMWSVGLYNAYCRMNPMTIKKDDVNDILDAGKSNWHRAFKTLSLIRL